MNIVQVSTFGPIVRGVSPYSDGLLEALNKHTEHNIIPMDYSYLYPSFLIPSKAPELAGNPWAYINTFSKKTWHKVFDKNPDLIHLQYWSFINLHFLIYISNKARKKGIPIVVTVHNPSSHETLLGVDLIENYFFKQATNIIVHTANGRKRLIQRGIENKKITHIAHGIKREELNTDKIKKDQILYFGNIRKYKGILNLLQAWESIKNKHPNTHLVIAGRTWQGKNPIQRLIGHLLGNSKLSSSLNEIKKKPNNQLQFHLEFIADEDLNKLIDESKICIFPYINFESQSGAATKAASRGTPILVSEVGGLPELAINKDWICAPNSPDDLATKLDNVLGCWNNKHLSMQQIKKIQPFTWNIVAEKHIELFQYLTSK